MNGPHLSDIALIVLAASRKPHPHLDACAWCREQYEALIAMEDYEEADAETPVDGAGEAPAYRLAAQSDVEMESGLVLRQTWYLDHGNVLLRIFEERGERLVAYVICAPERLHRLRFHFSGLPDSYVPGDDGRFIVGPVDLPVEPMTVTFEEQP